MSDMTMRYAELYLAWRLQVQVGPGEMGFDCRGGPEDGAHGFRLTFAARQGVRIRIDGILSGRAATDFGIEGVRIACEAEMGRIRTECAELRRRSALASDADALREARSARRKT